MRAMAKFDQAIQRTRDASGDAAARGACELADITFKETREQANFYDILVRGLTTAAAIALVAAIVMLFVDIDAVGPIVSGLGTLLAGGAALFVKGQQSSAEKAATEAIGLVAKYCGKERAASLTT